MLYKDGQDVWNSYDSFQCIKKSEYKLVECDTLKVCFIGIHSVFIGLELLYNSLGALNMIYVAGLPDCRMVSFLKWRLSGKLEVWEWEW